MPDLTPPLLASLAILGVVWIIGLVRQGPAVAAGIVTLASLALPRWVQADIVGAEIGLRTAAGVVSLGVMAVWPGYGIRTKLVWSDLLVAGLVIQTAVADAMNQTVPWMAGLRSYGEWAIPYLVGRYAVRDGADIRALAPWALGVIGIVAAATVLNFATGANVYDRLFGEPPNSDFGRDVKRFGFVRATGPAEHPIFLAAIFLTLLPWAWAATRDHRGSLKAVGWMAIAAVLAGVACGISRGPVVAAAVIAAVAVLFWLPVLKWPAILLAVGGAAAAAVYHQPIVDWASKTSDESKLATDVEIDGQRYESSNTRNRLLIWRLYAPEVNRRPLVGYGTAAVDNFPPAIPGLDENERTMYLLRYVDNTYLYLAIRMGWIGTALIAGLLLTSIVIAARLAPDRSLLGFPAAAASTLAGLAVLLATVYLSYNFAFEVLLLCGAVSGMRAGPPNHF